MRNSSPLERNRPRHSARQSPKARWPCCYRDGCSSSARGSLACAALAARRRHLVRRYEGGSTVTIRDAVLEQVRLVAQQQKKKLAVLDDSLRLAESGLDSLCFA